MLDKKPGTGGWEVQGERTVNARAHSSLARPRAACAAEELQREVMTMSEELEAIFRARLNGAVTRRERASGSPQRSRTTSEQIPLERQRMRDIVDAVDAEMNTYGPAEPAERTSYTTARANDESELRPRSTSAPGVPEDAAAGGIMSNRARTRCCPLEAARTRRLRWPAAARRRSQTGRRGAGPARPEPPPLPPPTPSDAREAPRSAPAGHASPDAAIKDPDSSREAPGSRLHPPRPARLHQGRRPRRRRGSRCRRRGAAPTFEPSGFRLLPPREISDELKLRDRC